MGKKYFLELSILDEGTFVKAAMTDGQRLVLDYENTDTKQVRIRAPLPDRDKFIERLQHWVEKGYQSSLEESVEFYIRSREKEIFDQVQEIRKSMKRINKFMQCLKIAREELNNVSK